MRDIVPARNNLVANYKWCYPCNQAHNQATCSNEVINQAFMVQNATSIQQDASSTIPEQQQDVHPNETAFLN